MCAVIGWLVRTCKERAVSPTVLQERRPSKLLLDRMRPLSDAGCRCHGSSCDQLKSSPTPAGALSSSLPHAFLLSQAPSPSEPATIYASPRWQALTWLIRPPQAAQRIRSLVSKRASPMHTPSTRSAGPPSRRSTRPSSREYILLQHPLSEMC